MSEADQNRAPVSAGERITSIDTLRGFAVLGILVMNIYAFSMSAAAYENPLAMGGTEWYNLGTWYVTHLFFDQKFLTIFAILFGAGLAMMSVRVGSRGGMIGRYWFRRNAWLLMIGAAHGYLLWFGDILYSYALLGFLIYPFRHQTPKALLIIACLILPIGTYVTVGGASLAQYVQGKAPVVQALRDSGGALTDDQVAILDTWESVSDELRPPQQIAADDLAAYSQGYPAIVAHRAPEVWDTQTGTFLAYTMWRVGAIMLIGMALFKLGILSGDRDPPFYRMLMLACYGAGFPLAILSAWQATIHDWDPLWMLGVGGISNYFGSILVGVGHIALVMTIIQSGAMKRLTARLAAVGRMAFTNYLMHSLVMTTIFYGYGLGLYGQVPRFWQMAFVAGMLGFQLWFSTYWLERYRFGPAEWLWRSLTYFRLQPMRRIPGAV